MFIVGNKSDHSFIDYSRIYGDGDTPESSVVIPEVAERENLDEEDISYYFLSEASDTEIVDKIQSRYDFDLEWDDSHEIVGVVFPTQTDKPSMFILGKRSDHSLIEYSGIYYGSGVPGVSVVIPNVSKNKGITEEDIAFRYLLSVSDEEIIKRIQDQDSFDLVWDDDDEITGIDFSSQDNKACIRLSTDKYEFEANGIDGSTITITVYDKDNVEIYPYNGSVKTTVITPLGTPKLLSLAFVNGVYQSKLKSFETGIWRIPSTKPEIFKMAPGQDVLVITSYTTDTLL